MKKFLFMLFVLLSVISARAGEKEAYGVLSDSILTLYYDDSKNNREGDVFDISAEGEWIPGWYWKSAKKAVKRVVIELSFKDVRPASTFSWFGGFENMTSIVGLENLNTSEVTSMEDMFYRCRKVTAIDVSSFNTSKVTDMSFMFYDCQQLASIDLGKIDTKEVATMKSMFTNCRNLSYLDVSSLNTSKVTDMYGMFYACVALEELDLSNFNTSNVTDMSHMFQSCISLTTLDISSFNTSEVTKMNDMFHECTSLTTLDVSNFNTAKVTDMSSMFNKCIYLTTIYCNDTWSASKSTDMFYECYNLVGEDGTTYTSGGKIDVTRAHPNTGGYFTKIAPKEVYVLYNNGTLTFYYDRQKASREGTVYELPENENNTPEWTISNPNDVNVAVIDESFAKVRPTSTYRWFCGLVNMTAIHGLEYLNTEEVTNMAGMFLDCRSLTSLDVTGFNTSNVTNMNGMFSACGFDADELNYLDVNSFDITNVTDMRYMFSDSKHLMKIYCDHAWNTEGKDTEDMFSYCLWLVGEDGTECNYSLPAEVMGNKAHPNAGGLFTSTHYQITGNKVGNYYWATYYNSEKGVRCESDVKIYTAKLSDDQQKMELTDRSFGVIGTISCPDSWRIPAGSAVILKSPHPIINLAGNMALEPFDNNSLSGSDTEISTSGVSGTVYTLAYDADDGLGFYQYTGETLGAHKAWLAIEGGNNVRGFSFEEVATAVNAAKTAPVMEKNVFFNLNGQRVNTPKRGLYIVNGKKVVK